MQKKLYVALLILAAWIGLLTVPATAATVLASGECGANGNDVTWTLDRGGLLTVSGAGDMYDYDRVDDVPWHAYLEQITSVTIETGVTNVGANAFRSCTRLTAVALPATGLRSINVMAFYQCASLASITIPRSVTKIGDNAFGFCALTTVEIPANVTDIGGSAFYKCAALSAINVNEANAAYSSIDGVLFDHDQSTLICFPAQKGLTEYTVPATVKTVGSYAFHSNQTLTKVTFPTVKDANGNPKPDDEAGKLETIGAYAFAYNAALEDITFPATLSTVGDYAFFECTSLSNEAGEATGTVRYEGSRQEWTALSIGNLGNTRLTNANVVFTDMIQDNIAASGECGALGNNASWSLTKDGELRISGAGAMQDYRNAESVPWAAYKADGADPQITKVTILSGITNVGDYALFECHRLVEADLAETVTRIGSTDSLYSRAFADCSALTTINLSETTVESIGAYAFNGCSALAGVTFPDTLLTIGQRAFLNCVGLTQLTLPAALTEVGDWAFRGCTRLTSLIMEPLRGGESAHYMSFGSYALADCSALETLSFSENLTVIGDYALNKCVNLAAVTLPANVSRVGNCALLGCPALETVNVDEKNQTYCVMNSMLMNKDQTYILYYPSGRTSAACAIPESVTSVAPFAFQEAGRLTTVYYGGSPSQWNRDVAPNIGLPNDPLANILNDSRFMITENVGDFHCEKEDEDPADETSIGNTLTDTTEDGDAVLVSVHCGKDVLGAMALCAWYDEEGRFLLMDAADLSAPGADYDLQFLIPDGAAKLRIFVMDGDNLPQCVCVTYDDFYYKTSE